MSSRIMRAKAYHTELDIQRGLLIGVSHKRIDFTTYVFNVGWTDPTVVLSLAWIIHEVSSQKRKDALKGR